MTGARPYEDQGALFGDLDGLFATVELLPITPVAEIRLVPTQGGMFTEPAPAVCDDYQPTIAGRWGDRPADDPDNPCINCHQPRHAHNERPGPDLAPDWPDDFTEPADHDPAPEMHEMHEIECQCATCLLGGPVETLDTSSAAVIRARLAAKTSPVLAPADDDEPDHDADACALCGMHAYGWIEYHAPGCEAGYGLCQQCPDEDARPATVEALHEIRGEPATERVCAHHGAVHDRTERLGHMTCHHCLKPIARPGCNGASGGPDGTLCKVCDRAGHQLPTADAPGALF